MKYYVNENCIGCGMCNGICPAVFGFLKNVLTKNKAYTFRKA